MQRCSLISYRIKMIRAAAIFGGDDSAIAKLSKLADFYAVPHIILTSMAYFSVRIYTSLHSNPVLGRP